MGESSHEPANLVGRTEPRLWTPPLRPLTRDTTRGFEVIDFANRFGMPFLPWQEFLVVHGLELLPDGRYRFRIVVVLVARQNGKTTVKRVVSLWRLFIDRARLILGTAQDLSLAREVWQACIDVIQGDPDLADELDCVRRTNGDEYLRLVSGGRYKIAATTRSAGRGLSVDELNIDELREQRSWDAWSAVSKTTMAREYSQTWAMSNAGDDQSVVLNQLREAALSGRDPSLGLFEWSAPDGCDLDDDEATAQANPSVGHPGGITWQAIRSARATDPPSVYRTEVLCQRVDTLDSAIDLGAWKDCRDPAGDMTSIRDRLAACVDVAPDGAHVTLAVAGLADDGRVRIELVDSWDSVDAALFELPEWLDTIGPRAVAWYPTGPSSALGPLFRRLPKPDKNRRRKTIEVVELTGAKVAEACQTFAAAVLGRRVTHAADALLDAHIAGAQKLWQGDGWRFVRRGSGHVDAAYSAAGAVHTVLTLPDEQVQPRMKVV
jgi:hypothetical protein